MCVISAMEKLGSFFVIWRQSLRAAVANQQNFQANTLLPTPHMIQRQLAIEPSRLRLPPASKCLIAHYSFRSCPLPDLNWRLFTYHANTLPTELKGQTCNLITKRCLLSSSKCRRAAISLAKALSMLVESPRGVA